MADIVGSAYNWLAGFNFWWVFWIFIIGVIITWIIVLLRNRIVYIYPVRIFKTRESGGVKEINWKGGYIGRKNSASFFKIKGRFPWQKINLNTTPNPKYMDQDNRVYYKQIDLGSYIQLKRNFDRDAIIFSPVEQDVKYGAILDIQKIKEVLRVENPWKKVAPYFALVIVFIFGILGFWFVTNGKCPGR